MNSTLDVALLSECFFGDGAEERLTSRLVETARRGAEIVLLPELPFQEWRPWTKESRDEDAEGAGGPRASMLARASKAAGIAVVGGAILRDADTGRRESHILLADTDGNVSTPFAKIHLPEEEGFWETSHYDSWQGDPTVVEVAGGFPVGFQVCSDCNRPQGSQLLGAQGALAILSPRATERITWERWRTVMRANAITTSCYFLSVNRPAPEFGVLIGGPSFAADPRGDVLCETLEPLAVVRLDRRRVEECRLLYPGYLARYPKMYARVWDQIARSGSS